jgi:hypothetical protein
MDESFNTIRSLNTEFAVKHRGDDEIVLSVDVAEVAGVKGPANLKFTHPRRPWASRWDSAKGTWQDAPELSTPENGFIREAFIKPVPSGLSLSFSDGQAPVVRWGFIADDLSIEHWLGRHNRGAEPNISSKRTR